MRETEKLDGILNERKIYGEYEDVAAMNIDAINVYNSRPEYARNLSKTEQSSLLMILHKLSRVCCGTEYSQDHWDDIANYARLVKEDR